MSKYFGLFVLLFAALFAVNEAEYTVHTCKNICPSDGVYRWRSWYAGESLLEEPSTFGMVKVIQYSPGIFFVDWMNIKYEMVAYYNPTTQNMVGGWYGPVTHAYGFAEYHFDGIRLGGRWTCIGFKEPGYEDWTLVRAFSNTTTSCV